MNAIEQVMFEKLGEEWFNVLCDEINKPYFYQMAMGLSVARKTKTIYPDADDVFKAYKFTKPDDVKVVILGQDPYYNGKADGLCFSYKDGLGGAGSITTPKQSLDVIFQEIEEDIKFGLYLDYNYNLRWLAEQGILLLNTVLTVERNKPGSHKDKGWENFTNVTLEHLLRSQLPRVFMIWGSDARNAIQTLLKLLNIEQNLHLFLYAPHPASDLYKRDQFGDIKADYPNTFRGCKHFSQANKFLEGYYRNGIIW